MERTILHSDMNSFYASVECLYHPELKGKPVAVCGDVEQRHGIILAKTQQAKRFGVSTGEPIWQAKQKCPNLITVPAHFDLYMNFSNAAKKIYQRYSDLIEPFGLDESWIDVTGNNMIHGSGEKIAQEISQTIKHELGVTVSIGVSWNKIFAKLGSDYKKPDAITVISKENFKNIVWQLPASDLFYVGRATTRKLANYGIHTIGQLAQTDSDFLRRILGKWGEHLWSFANGYDISQVAPSGYCSPIKSIGNSITTYRDIESSQEAWQVLLALSENVARRLRENGFRCRTVQISVRDKNLNWFECQTKIEIPCCTVESIAEAANKLLNNHYSFSVPLRSLGVRACDLVSLSEGVQLTFCGNPLRQAKLERLESCVDNLRERFGRDAVKRASLIGADIIGEADPLTHEVHPVAYFS